MGFRFQLRVRFADTDAQGHVFFANYLTYFDEAMGAYLREIGFSWQQMLGIGVDVVYKDAHVTYDGRATFEDLIEIATRISRIGNTSLTTELVATKSDGSAIARGELVSVCVDRESMKPVRVPDQLREAVDRYEG